MRIASQVFENLFRSTKRRLGVDNPIGSDSEVEQSLKLVGMAQPFDLAVEPKLLCSIGTLE